MVKFFSCHCLAYSIAASLSVVSLVCASSLETMVVSASRIEVPLRQVGASVTVVSRDDIALMGYRSLADILATQPGITFSNNGGAGKLSALQVRGEAGFRTHVLIDGVSALDPSGPQASTRIEHLIMTDAIERIEILRGPQAFIYGGHAGGVVNIITRQQSSNSGFSVSSTGGSYGFRENSASVTRAQNNQSLTIAFHDESIEGYNSLKADRSGESDGYDNTTLEINLHQALNEQASLNLSGRQVKADNAYDNCFSATEDCTNQFDQSLAHMQLRFSNAVAEHELMFSFNQTESRFFTDGLRAFNAGGERQQGGYLVNFFLNQALGWTLGFDFQREKLDQGIFRNQRAALTEWQWQPIMPLTMTLGIRHDNHDGFGEHTIARATASLLQNVGDQSLIKYRASIGTGFRAPSLFETANDLALQPGAGIVSRLNAEKSRGWDTGLDWYFEKAHLGITFFDQQVTDQIDYDYTFFGYRQYEGVSRSKGIEVMGRKPLMLGISVTGNATYNKTFDRNGNQRVRRPKKIGNLGLSWRSKAQKLTASTHVRFARDAVGLGGTQVPDYVLLDIGAHFKVSPEFSLIARVQNLTDRDYELAKGYETEKRNVLLGLRLIY